MLNEYNLIKIIILLFLQDNNILVLFSFFQKKKIFKLKLKKLLYIDILHIS